MNVHANNFRDLAAAEFDTTTHGGGLVTRSLALTPFLERVDGLTPGRLRSGARLRRTPSA